MRRIFICLLIIVMMLSGCNFNSVKADGTVIKLSDDKITVDGKKITDNIKKAVYCANDIVYYASGMDFTYGEGTKQDEHEKTEADKHKVVHITKPGKYILSGKLSFGQIAVDLGKDAKNDSEAVVTLVLDGVDITCSVAPAILFYNVYECGKKDEETAVKDVDTKKAGANVIIADDSKNNIKGSYVAKIYESYKLNEDGTKIADSKKLHKYDGAFYSRQTMNITGGIKDNGILNIKAENEGLNSELHLTINGGIINIVSGNDGINTNEDNVSVTTINGGKVNILCDGTTGEGDGIDSNGWLVINGGTIVSQACATSMDAGIDSDKGIYINGGKLIASGNMLDHISGGDATYAVFNFKEKQDSNGTYTLKSADGEKSFEYALKNAFTYLIVADSELTPGDYNFMNGENKLYGAKMKDRAMPMPDVDFSKIPSEFKDKKRPPIPEENFVEGSNRREKKGESFKMPPEMRNGAMMPQVEVSEVFNIIKGGNNFAGVSKNKPE